jgi:hypothetical protein
VGAATFWDPQSPVRIAHELSGSLRREGISNVSRIVRALELQAQGLTGPACVCRPIHSVNCRTVRTK